MKINNAAAAFVLALLTGLTGCDSSSGFKTGQVVESNDPIVVEFPIAFVARPLPLNDDGGPGVDDILDPTSFNPGARLIVKDRASASAPERNITDRAASTDDNGEPVPYDVKDLAVNADGSRLAFALRIPDSAMADEDDHFWQIYEYDLEQDTLTAITNNNMVPAHNVAPQYLPDGRLIYASTRQESTRSILPDDGRSQYQGLDENLDREAFVLHVTDREGKVSQWSYNASHDLQPTVLSSGEVVYLRQDAIAGHNELSLYRMNPDGTRASRYYGYHSQETGSNNTDAVWSQPVELEDGRLMAILRPRVSTRFGGELVAINADDFIDNRNPVWANAGASGPGQTSLTGGEVSTDESEISLGGYFSAAYPLHDGTGRLLASWSQCRQIDPQSGAIRPCSELLISQGAEEAPPLFGLWIYDPESNTQLPVKLPEEGTMFSDAVVLSPGITPAYEPPTTDAELALQRLAVVHIRNVYDIDGNDRAPGGIEAVADPARTPPDERPVRFIRLVKSVPIPDDDVRDFDNSAYGRSRAQLMREIIGYVPVEPDGSASFYAPSEVPLMLDLLDASGKRIGGRHQNWLTLRPGETFECTGCHERNAETGHGRLDAEPPSIYGGAVGGVPFTNSRLLDDFDTPEAAPQAGETMAQYRTRLAESPLTPSVDITYEDDWTDPAAATPGTPISLRYVDISLINNNPADSRCQALDPAPPLWQSPSSCDEATAWSATCRITVNYIANIHPLWEADRRSCDEQGFVVNDNTCTSCHSRGPADALQVPAGQLELTGEVSADRNDYITSYAELMFRDNEQEVIENSLTDRIIEVDTGEFETDADGNLILDENNNPIPIIEQQTVPLPVPLSVNGARASNRFFSRFEAGGSHAGWLTPAELKLIAEWLDVGGQYYNDPFRAPAD